MGDLPKWQGWHAGRCVTCALQANRCECEKPTGRWEATMGDLNEAEPLPRILNVFALDVDVYDRCGKHPWATARFLVHGTDGPLWTNDPAEAAAYVQAELERIVAGGDDAD